ncbi:MAG: stage III sporulation AC/AD family protein [Clostridia bacterium]|nr:stage III sporulation AC/AD family protein [Clostridia bacterium]
MENFKIYGIIICAVCLCIVFKGLHSEYSLFIRLAVTIGISITGIAILFPALTYINEISKGTQIEKFLPSLVKSLGIALTVQITADCCKDAGEEGIASRIYLFGQAEILIICLPIIKGLFSLCSSILE